MSNRAPQGATERTTAWILHATVGLIFVFMYVPMLTLVVFSFNESRFLVFPLSGLSWKWYGVLLANADIQRSIWNSIVVAVAVVPCTLLIGIPLALIFHRHRFFGSAVIERLTLIPLIVPGLITGLGILLLAKHFDVSLSLWTVILGHTVGWLPVVVTQVQARLRRLDPRLEEASLDLGATPWQTFWRVTFPGIRNAVLGSSLLVMTLSLNEVAITFFLTGKDNTLPMHIWSMLRQGITPEINAIATITMAISVVVVVVALRVLRPRDE